MNLERLERRARALRNTLGTPVVLVIQLGEQWGVFTPGARRMERYHSEHSAINAAHGLAETVIIIDV